MCRFWVVVGEAGVSVEELEERVDRFEVCLEGRLSWIY